MKKWCGYKIDSGLLPNTKALWWEKIHRRWRDNKLRQVFKYEMTCLKHSILPLKVFIRILIIYLPTIGSIV